MRKALCRELQRICPRCNSSDRRERGARIPAYNAVVPSIKSYPMPKIAASIRRWLIQGP
jgi:hypothetical protein